MMGSRALQPIKYITSSSKTTTVLYLAFQELMTMIITAWTWITIMLNLFPSFSSTKYFGTMLFNPCFYNLFIQFFIVSWPNFIIRLRFLIGCLFINAKSIDKGNFELNTLILRSKLLLFMAFSYSSS